MAALAGRVAIVTGGSRGIGAAIANALAGAGAAVAIAARDGNAATEIARAIGAGGGDACGLRCDVADYAAVEAMVDEALGIRYPRHSGEQRRRDRADRSAGGNRPDRLGPQRQCQSDWGLNVIRATLPHMIAKRSGTVINITSGAAHRALEGWSAYCCAKAGLAMLTSALALENAPSGVRVFGLAPGVVDTDMQVTIRASGINRVSKIPRVSLAPVEHPAAAVVYLCSDAADDLIGKEVVLLDPEFRRRIGLH